MSRRPGARGRFVVKISWFCLAWLLWGGSAWAGTINFSALVEDNVLTITYTGDNPQTVSLIVDGGDQVAVVDYLRDSTDPYFDIFPDFFAADPYAVSPQTGHPLAHPTNPGAAVLPSHQVAISAAHLLGESDGSHKIATLRVVGTSGATITLRQDLQRQGNEDSDGAMTTNLPLAVSMSGDPHYQLFEDALIACTITPGVDPAYGSFYAKGAFDATAEQMAQAESIKITLQDDHGFTYREDLPFSAAYVRNGVFSWQNPSLSSPHTISQFNFSTASHTFRCRGFSLPLAGVHSPIRLQLELGNYHHLFFADETIINGRQNLSLRFLRGREDSLRINAAKLTSVGRSHRLTLRGDLAAAQTYDLKQLSLSFNWGEQRFTLPSGSFTGSSLFYLCDNKSLNQGGRLTALIDLKRGTFLIILNGVTLEATEGTVAFRLVFGEFDVITSILL